MAVRKAKQPIDERLYVAAGTATELFGMLASVNGAFILFLLSPGLFPDQEGLLWQLILVLFLLL